MSTLAPSAVGDDRFVGTMPSRLGSPTAQVFGTDGENTISGVWGQADHCTRWHLFVGAMEGCGRLTVIMCVFVRDLVTSGVHYEC